MTSRERMDAILDWLKPHEIVDCLAWIELQHRHEDMPDDEAAAWVLRILAGAAFLELDSEGSPAD